MKLLASIALIIASIHSVSAQAQNLYRYLDDNGETVITGNIPKHVSARGYEIIDKYGRVIEVYAPHQTGSNSAALLKETERLQQHEARRQRDAELLRLYSSADEMRSELQRRIAEIEVQVELLEGSRIRTSNALDKLNKQALHLTKVDKAVPDYLSKDIKNKEDLLARNLSNITQLNNNIAAISNDFATDITRLDILLKQKQLQDGRLKLTHLNDNLLAGEWRNRENLWLDWTLNKDGTFSSTYQQLGSRERTENKGQWLLNGTSLIFTVDKRKTTDSRGVSSSKRLIEEMRTEILEADQKQLLVLISGQPVTLTRP